MKLRGFYANTHGIQAYVSGGIDDMLNEYDPDLVILVESARKQAKDALKRRFPAKDWSITGLLPHAPMAGGVGSGTHVMAKRDVLRRKAWRNPLVTPQRYVGGRRDKWHPVRRMTRARFVFDENRDLELEVGGDHSWTHAGFPIHGDHEVPTQHRHQIDRYARAAKNGIARGRAVLDVGDMNERPGDSYVEKKMEQAGMRLLASNRLDYIFASPGIVRDRVETIPPGRITGDPREHPGFVFDLRISTTK